MFSMFDAMGKASQKTIAIIDVGSASVGGALVRLNRKGPPTVIDEVRVGLAIDATRDDQTLARRLYGAIDQACTFVATSARVRAAQSKDVREQKRSYVEHVAVFLPAPWSSLVLRSLRLSRATPMTIGASQIERIINDYVKRERLDRPDEVVVERSALGLRLNGYAVSDIPTGTRATTVEMSIISTTAGREFLLAVREAVGMGIGARTTISFHTTGIAAAYALSAMRPDIPDYILVNNEGEVTELILVRDHTPITVSTAALGCAAVPRTLAAHGTPPAEIPSALALSANDSSPMAHKLDASLRAARRACTGALRDALQRLLSTDDAPRAMYILGDDSASWYADEVSTDQSIMSLLPKGAAVEAIRPALLAAVVKTRTPERADILLTLEALYADARFDEKRTFNFRMLDKRG